METYEFRNDTCFLSVTLQNLTDYVIIPFLPSGTLQNFTDFALTLSLLLIHFTSLVLLTLMLFFILEYETIDLIFVHQIILIICLYIIYTHIILIFLILTGRCTQNGGIANGSRK